MESLPSFEEIDVQKYLQVLQRRWLPAALICGTVVSLATLTAITIKPNYKSEGNILIKPNRTSSLTGLGENLGRLEALYTNNPLTTQTKILTSTPIIEKTIRSLNLKDGKGKPLKLRDFNRKLKVENIVGSDIVQVSYTDEDPELATKVVNKIINTYIKENVDANQAEALLARKFIKEQLPTAEASVKQAELQLQEFKQKNKVILLTEETAGAVRTITNLEGQISQAQARLVDVNARIDKLRSEAAVNSQGTVMSAELSQTAGVQKVLAQLQDAESQLKTESTRFQSGHPAIVNLEEKIAALRSLLNQRTQSVIGTGKVVQQGDLQLGELRQSLIAEITRAESERAGLEKQIGTLSNQWSAYKERASNLPKLEQTQRELERRLKAGQSTYETLLTKLQEIIVAENQRISNARVISYASVPDTPSGPRRIIIIIAGGVIGVFIGVVGAFALDLIDGSVKTVKEAREVFKYTTLGVIPALSRNSKQSSSIAGVDRPLPQVIGRDVPHYPFGNAYQILQANLKFLGSDKQLKSIVVTSSVAKEGKSEVAANLAVAMAAVGRRVLLVDANMRYPMQHHVWGMTNAVGLSNVIVDQIPVETSVQEVMPNLDVLSAGVVPPNPIALLDSKRMSTLVDSFAEAYDFVIFDAPALVGTADAAVLGELTNGILLVARPGVVDWNSANGAKEFLKQSGQNVLGMVINGVNVRREPDSYFYYSNDSIESDTVSRTKVFARKALSGKVSEGDAE